MHQSQLFLAWTTVATREDALQLSRRVLEENLAICSQVDGPIVSAYRWEGRIEEAEEFRITLKALGRNLAALEDLVLRLHSYDTPEWVAVPVTIAAEKYLNWAERSSS